MSEILKMPVEIMFESLFLDMPLESRIIGWIDRANWLKANHSEELIKEIYIVQLKRYNSKNFEKTKEDELLTELDILWFALSDKSKDYIEEYFS